MPTVECPAGERIEETIRGRACRCRIEHSTIAVGRDPRSLTGFCEAKPFTFDDEGNRAGFDICPTWQADHDSRETGDLIDERLGEGRLS